MQKFDNFDEYLESIPEIGKMMLLKIRELFHQLIPDIEESMSYGVPAFNLKKDAKMNDKIMVAGFKKHIGIYPHPSTIEAFKEQLESYKLSKGTIQFQYKDELPLELIKDIILFRYREINA